MKKAKRVLSAVLALVLILGLAPVQSRAEIGTQYDFETDDFYYNKDKDTTVGMFASIEEVKDKTKTSYTIPFDESFGGDKSYGVATIRESVFSGFTNLKEIKIADNNGEFTGNGQFTLGRILANAFSGCVNLEKILLPHSLWLIGDGAFSGCKSLTLDGVFNLVSGEYVLPEGMKEIGAKAFSGCVGFAGNSPLVIPSNVTVYSKAFENCKDLTLKIMVNGPTKAPSYYFGSDETEQGKIVYMYDAPTELFFTSDGKVTWTGLSYSPFDSGEVSYDNVRYKVELLVLKEGDWLKTAVSTVFVNGDPNTKSYEYTFKAEDFAAAGTYSVQVSTVKPENSAEEIQDSKFAIADMTNIYTVTFDGMGLEGNVPPAQTVISGGKVTEPSVELADRDIEGWYTEAVYTNKWDFANSTVSADTTLYAKLAVPSCVCDTMCTPDAVNSACKACKLNPKDCRQIPWVNAAVLRTGETAAKVEISAESGSLEGWTYYYLVSQKIETGHDEVLAGTATAEKSLELSSLGEDSKYFHVLGVKDGVNTMLCTVGIPAYVPPKYWVTVTESPIDGSGGETVGQGEYFPGETVTLTAAPAEGYCQVSWFVNGAEVSAEEGYSFTMPETDVQVSVSFGPHSYEFVDLGDGTHQQKCAHCLGFTGQPEAHADSNDGLCDSCNVEIYRTVSYYNGEDSEYDEVPNCMEYALSECMFEAAAKMRFAGWGTEKNGGEIYAPGTEIKVTGDLTYFAQWEEIPCDISSDWSYDLGNHWHDCPCGEKHDLEAHKFNFNGKRCLTCGYAIGMPNGKTGIQFTPAPGVELPAGSYLKAEPYDVATGDVKLILEKGGVGLTDGPAVIVPGEIITLPDYGWKYKDGAILRYGDRVVINEVECVVTEYAGDTATVMFRNSEYSLKNTGEIIPKFGSSGRKVNSEERLISISGVNYVETCSVERNLSPNMSGRTVYFSTTDGMSAGYYVEPVQVGNLGNSLSAIPGVKVYFYPDCRPDVLKGTAFDGGVGYLGGGQFIFDTGVGVDFATVGWANDIAMYAADGTPVTVASGDLTIYLPDSALWGNGDIGALHIVHIEDDGVSFGEKFAGEDNEELFGFKRMDHFSPFIVLEVRDFEKPAITLTGVTEVTPAPDTGVDMHIWLWVVLGLCAAVGGVICRKKLR